MYLIHARECTIDEYFNIKAKPEVKHLRLQLTCKVQDSFIVIQRAKNMAERDLFPGWHQNKLETYIVHTLI